MGAVRKDYPVPILGSNLLDVDDLDVRVSHVDLLHRLGDAVGSERVRHCGGRRAGSEAKLGVGKLETKKGVGGLGLDYGG